MRHPLLVGCVSLVLAGPIPVAAPEARADAPPEAGPSEDWMLLSPGSGPPLAHMPQCPFGLASAASLASCLEDAWHYVHIEYLSAIFRHSSTHKRFLGLGEPLISSSWRNRPLHVGWFVGAMFPDDLIGSRVVQDKSLFGGYRAGWDFDHYWGAEWRIGWSRPDLSYPRQSQSGPSGRLMLTDLSLLYYPWGDSVIRPYGLLGLGITDVDFHDDMRVRRDERLFSVPFGGGVKHHYHRWLSWRLELLDNFAAGSGSVGSMHNISLTFSIEVHFGVRPRSYYPWNPSRHIW